MGHGVLGTRSRLHRAVCLLPGVTGSQGLISREQGRDPSHSWRLSSPRQPWGAPYSTALGKSPWGPICHKTTVLREIVKLTRNPREAASEECKPLNVVAPAPAWLTAQAHRPGQGLRVPTGPRAPPAEGGQASRGERTSPEAALHLSQSCF